MKKIKIIILIISSVLIGTFILKVLIHIDSQNIIKTDDISFYEEKEGSYFPSLGDFEYKENRAVKTFFIDKVFNSSIFYLNQICC